MGRLRTSGGRDGRRLLGRLRPWRRRRRVAWRSVVLPPFGLGYLWGSTTFDRLLPLINPNLPKMASCIHTYIHTYVHGYISMYVCPRTRLHVFYIWRIGTAACTYIHTYMVWLFIISSTMGRRNVAYCAAGFLYGDLVLTCILIIIPWVGRGSYYVLRQCIS